MGVDEVEVCYTSNLEKAEEMVKIIVIADEMQETMRKKIIVCLVQMICLIAGNLATVCYKLIRSNLALDSQYTMHYTTS